MKIDIEIKDKKVCNFTEGALRELNSQSKKVIENLIDEAIRVEAALREPDTRQEITQSDVKEAARVSHKNYRYKSKKWKFILGSVYSLAIFLSGVIFEMNNSLRVLVSMVIFIISLCIKFFLNNEGYE